MINQIRADFYRQLHTVGMYIMLAVTIVYALLAVLAKSVGGVTVSVGSSVFTQIADRPWTVLFGLKAANMTATLLLYFFIGVFVIVFGYEFTQKVYKNTLISGISRLQFILAKYLVMLLDLLILVTVNFGMVLIGGLIKGRALGGDWSTILQTMGLGIVAATFFSECCFQSRRFLVDRNRLDDNCYDCRGAFPDTHRSPQSYRTLGLAQVF